MMKSIYDTIETRFKQPIKILKDFPQNMLNVNMDKLKIYEEHLSTLRLKMFTSNKDINKSKSESPYQIFFPQLDPAFSKSISQVNTVTGIPYLSKNSFDNKTSYTINIGKITNISPHLSCYIQKIFDNLLKAETNNFEIFKSPAFAEYQENNLRKNNYLVELKGLNLPFINLKIFDIVVMYKSEDGNTCHIFEILYKPNYKTYPAIPEEVLKNFFIWLYQKSSNKRFEVMPYKLTFIQKPYFDLVVEYCKQKNIQKTPVDKQIEDELKIASVKKPDILSYNLHFKGKMVYKITHGVQTNINHFKDVDSDEEENNNLFNQNDISLTKIQAELQKLKEYGLIYTEKKEDITKFINVKQANNNIQNTLKKPNKTNHSQVTEELFLAKVNPTNKQELTLQTNNLSDDSDGEATNILEKKIKPQSIESKIDSDVSDAESEIESDKSDVDSDKSDVDSDASNSNSGVN